MKIVAASEDQLVVVTHPSNLVDVSAEDLYRLYFGKRSAHSGGDQFIPVINDGDEKLLNHFSSQMLQRSSQQLKSYWARQLFTGKLNPPATVRNSVELKDLIASNPQYIGYMWESDLDSSVRVVLPRE